MKVRIICATRLPYDEFFSKTALGRSAPLYKKTMKELLEVVVYPENTRGLSELYNEAIDYAVTDPAVLLFIHDDVCLNDFYWYQRLLNGLKKFDIVGIAGNTRRAPKQPNWYFLTDTQEAREDFSYLSGVLGHGKGFYLDMVSVYGDSGQACKLLDGLFIAVKSETLIAHQLRFDPQFTFDFYDMDFCRQAELRGLNMGTWQISVIHESVGNFTENWHQAYHRYLQKYGE